MRVSSMLGHKDTKQTAHYIGVMQERDSRNASIAGKSMFPQLQQGTGLRLVEGEGHG